MGHVVIFGGTGFIGTHLAQHLLRHSLAERVTLADLQPPRDEPYAGLLQQGLESGQVDYVRCDVREPIPASLTDGSPEIVFNLAAIHREPGHKPAEYFETNLRGAQNVCNYAAATGCERLVFTSSISPYGPTEDRKDETSLPVPETAYGSSKLVAEQIHQSWHAEATKRQLLILRPGVIFGPGENGNVTLLVRSVAKGYFVYIGNRNTRKAGGYVKELCHVIQFGLEYQRDTGERLTLLNFSTNPPPSLEEFVETIRKVAGTRGSVLSVPRSLVLGASYLIAAVSTVAGIAQPINPVRVRKLYRSTWIDPMRLRNLGYKWRYNLEDAFGDWKLERPQDFAL